jgi:hypothetical protein
MIVGVANTPAHYVKGPLGRGESLQGLTTSQGRDRMSLGLFADSFMFAFFTPYC